VLVKDVLHGDASGFSLAIGAFGIGGSLGAVGLLGVDAQRDRRWLSSGFAASYGAITAVAAINLWFWGLPILLVFAGLSMAVSNTSANANALLQATVAARLRGRTISLFMLAVRGGISIGSLIIGVSVNLLGVRCALLINGILALAAPIMIERRWTRTALPALGPGL